MGLDITAYEQVTLVKAIPPNEADDYPNGDRYLYVMREFATTADGLVSGRYSVSGEVYGFKAGSYSGYNVWRRHLAELIGTSAQAVWDDPKPGPFVELINNADNGGLIGPSTSGKLAADFAEWQSRADVFAPSNEEDSGQWFRKKYAEWRKAFELSAHGGAVQLH